jgi:two-component sensor histidine kinase
MDTKTSAQPSSTVDELNRELRDAGPKLVGNDELLRGVLAGCGDCIKILDLEGRLQFMSEGGKRVMEVEDFSVLKGCPWPDFWADQGNEHAHAAVQTARTGGTYRFRGAADTARGTAKYWDVQVSPIAGTDGKPAQLLSISRDITVEWQAEIKRKEMDKYQAVLIEELQHRIKNTLAMVDAIANQTMRGNSVDKAREAFSARIIALSRAHEILTETSWDKAPVADVIEGALAVHRTGRDRIRCSGPHFALEAKQALALVLAVHELATNAAKYGSLSNDTGVVDVTWSADTGTNAFVFTWRESGGPLVVAPTRRGFGSRLIEGLLATDFDAEVRIAFDPGGVVCRLEAPLTNRQT